MELDGPMTRPTILAVGMLPPPFGGQALMFDRAIRALRVDYDVTVIDTQLHGNIGESGTFALRKVAATVKILLLRMLPLFARRKFDILYYCISGPSTFGTIKDLLFLSLLRARAHQAVYHFHGTGGVEFLLRKSHLLRIWARVVLFGPDLGLRCAEVTPNDAALCEAKREIIIYNGIDDPDAMVPGPVDLPRSETPSFVFVGALVEEKGVFDLVEIARLLRDRGHRFILHIVGEGTPADTAELDELIRRHNLGSAIKRTGVLVGMDKFRLLKSATIFLFPTYFRAETQPLAVIEAISLRIPVVASDWRGLNTIIDDGINGYLVAPRNPAAFTRAIERMLSGNTLEPMREAARRIFLERFRIERFADDLNQAFRSLESNRPSAATVSKGLSKSIQ